MITEDQQEADHPGTTNQDAALKQVMIQPFPNRHPHNHTLSHNLSHSTSGSPSLVPPPVGLPVSSLMHPLLIHPGQHWSHPFPIADRQCWNLWASRRFPADWESIRWSGVLLHMPDTFNQEWHEDHDCQGWLWGSGEHNPPEPVPEVLPP